MDNYDPNDPVVREERTVVTPAPAPIAPTPAAPTVVTTGSGGIIAAIIVFLVVVIGGWMWYTNTTPTQAVHKVETSTSNVYHDATGSAKPASN